MNGDIEKNRAEYVLHLENQVKHLQRQLNEIQAQSQWIPDVNMVMDTQDSKVRFTLSFNNKRATAVVTTDIMHASDPTSITSAIIESFSQNLIKDQFRPLIEPEVVKAKQGVAGIQGAGKW